MKHRRNPRALRSLAATFVLVSAAFTQGEASAAPAPCPPGATYGNPLPAQRVASRLVRSGFNFLEGPTWDAHSGTLLLSNMHNASGPEGVQPSTMLRFTPPATFETFISQSGSNGLAISADGSTVLAATHDRREVAAYRLSDRSRTTVAANHLGRVFNSPNDLTIRADGTVYFTDPSFQRGNRADQMGGRTGVFRVRNGVVSLVDDTLRQPNGVVLSPDGRTLYVGANGNHTIVKYTVNADGSTGGRTTFAPVNSPDGATVDCAGNVYWTSYSDGLVHVFSPTGVKLGTISAGRNATNAAFGGRDGRTLYITSGTYGNFGLYEVRLNVPGNPY